MSYTYGHPRPQMTVDIVLLAPRQGQWHVLLIQRKHPPFQGAWALPGGFVDEHEELPVAAARELAEETGARGLRLRQARTYGRPGRDPRGWAVTVAYFAVLDEMPDALQARDDAADIEWARLDRLPALAFDHAEIIADCCKLGLG